MSRVHILSWSITNIFMLAAVAILGGEASAQDTYEVKAGEEVRLAVLGSMKANCEGNPAPEVRVAGPVALGSIRIASAKLKTNRFPKCPDVELPVRVIFYKAAPNVSGTDLVTLEISESTGSARTQTFNIRVNGN